MNKTIELSTEELRSIVGGKCSVKGTGKAVIKGAVGGFIKGAIAGGNLLAGAGLGGAIGGAGYLATCWW